MVVEPSKMDWKQAKDFLEQINAECEFHPESTRDEHSDKWDNEEEDVDEREDETRKRRRPRPPPRLPA
jgi:hypothetical protein